MYALFRDPSHSVFDRLRLAYYFFLNTELSFIFMICEELLSSWDRSLLHVVVN